MYDEIKEKAKKKVEAKKGFYIVAFIFASVSVILLVLSLYVPFPASFWLRFPMLIFAMVLGILYLSIFGFPGKGVLSQEWEEEEMEREMARLYRQEKKPLHSSEELSEEDRLELKELERLKQKWEDGEEFV